MPNNKETTVSIQIDQNSPSFSNAASAKNQNLISIDQWTTAFSNLMAIYIEKKTQDAPHLLKYGSVIREIEANNGDAAWRYNDENFRKLRQSNNPYARPRMPGSIAATSNVVTTSERGAAFRGREAVPATYMMPIVTPAPILHPSIASVPSVIEQPSSSSQEQQIHQHVANYGQGITANPGTLNSFDSLTMALPFTSTVSHLRHLGVHVSQRLKEKIQNNAFVHLNKLLYHDPTCTQTTQIVF